jgi:hypothetical protein
VMSSSSHQYPRVMIGQRLSSRLFRSGQLYIHLQNPLSIPRGRLRLEHLVVLVRSFQAAPHSGLDSSRLLPHASGILLQTELGNQGPSNFSTRTCARRCLSRTNRQLATFVQRVEVPKWKAFERSAIAILRKRKRPRGPDSCTGFTQFTAFFAKPVLAVSSEPLQPPPATDATPPPPRTAARGTLAAPTPDRTARQR